MPIRVSLGEETCKDKFMFICYLGVLRKKKVDINLSSIVGWDNVSRGAQCIESLNKQ